MGYLSKIKKALLCFALCLPLSALAGDFVLEDMQGETHHLSDYRGKWVLVNFWATWCPPCLSEIPELSRLHNSHKDLVVIGIAMDYRSGRRLPNLLKRMASVTPSCWVTAKSSRKSANWKCFRQVTCTVRLANRSGIRWVK